MRVTQGTFSFLPDFTDQQIHEQVQYCIDNGWAVSIEYTDDPHPRNIGRWDIRMFDNPDAAAVVYELNECRKVYGSHYNRIIAFDHPQVVSPSGSHLLLIDLLRNLGLN